MNLWLQLSWCVPRTERKIWYNSICPYNDKFIPVWPKARKWFVIPTFKDPYICNKFKEPLLSRVFWRQATIDDSAKDGRSHFTQCMIGICPIAMHSYQNKQTGNSKQVTNGESSTNTPKGEWPSGLYSLHQVTDIKLGRVRSYSGWLTSEAWPHNSPRCLSEGTSN